MPTNVGSTHRAGGVLHCAFVGIVVVGGCPILLLVADSFDRIGVNGLDELVRGVQGRVDGEILELLWSVTG